MGVSCATCCGNRESKTHHQYNTEQVNLISKRNKHENEIKMNKIDAELFEAKISENQHCSSADSCIQIKRIILSMKMYDDTNINDQIITFFTETYKYLLNDYNHILLCHSNDIELIYQFIENNHNNIMSCAPKTCVFSKRFNRNRDQDDNHSNLQVTFWKDIMSQIHCYLIHLFHYGFRVRNKAVINDQNTDDLQQISIRKDMSNKPDYGYERIKNKFNINIEAEQHDISSFSIGYSFYYWDYYKNKSEVKQSYFNQNDHLGHPISELYVEKKYDNLKYELLNNTLHPIRINKYNPIVLKAKLYICCDVSKSTKAPANWEIENILHYGITKDTPLTINNLIAILFYTDTTNLSAAFSSTFRAISHNESLQSIKQRNREFRNWSKLFRETIEYFGDKLGVQRKTPFYCGLSYMVIPSFVIRLCSPTSTSKQLEVAVNFANEKGMVIQINNGSNTSSQFVRCFNCSWISCFNHEDERIFAGGFWPLRLESIKLMSTQENLDLFCKTFFYLDCMLSGIKLIYKSDAVNNINMKDFKIIKALINHKLNIKKNLFAKYINETFDTFCNHKKQVNIRLDLFNGQFVLFKKTFFESSTNVLNMDLMLKLFVKCGKLIICDDQNKNKFDVMAFVSSTIEMMKLVSDCHLIEIAIKVRRFAIESWLYSECQSHDFIASKEYNIVLRTETDDLYNQWDVLFVHHDSKSN